jgi:hypothetical protein
MRQIAAVVAASVLVTGCATNTHKIPTSELQRLAMVQPEQRGEHVRVQQELGEADVGPPAPVTTDTQIVFFPDLNVYGPDRRRYYRGSNASFNTGSGRVRSGMNLGGGKGGSGGLGGGGGDKGAAVAILVVAAVALVAVVAVEGSRFDGYARLHPMHPVYLEGKDGSRAVMPLAWIDPQTAAWTRSAYVRRNEGPWQQLERAPLDRQGWNFSMYGGSSILTGVDTSRGAGFGSIIQFGYFPSTYIGIVGSLFMGWRENEVGTTNFHARYGGELQFFPIASGLLHLGGYAGLGGAYRSDERFRAGWVVSHVDEGSSMYTGGGILQLDINTRIALTARVGMTNSFGERTADTLFGLSVY